ncbi:hypothetical protein KJ785_01110 [Patescibacteria group bacterium]|nr:hypothetical protein [Patescibacteria group bacterium]
MKKKVIVISVLIVSCLGLWLLPKGVLQYQAKASKRALIKIQNQAIENIIDSRRIKNSEETTKDPFGEDGVVRLLFIGLDTRVGQEAGHCDAIQLISIDKNDTGMIIITAVPRGTYSPLPPGKGTTSTDYYISNACGLGGLEYGIQQIEKILGVKPDYLVVVGFSETMGILRYLHLPTTETLQWLRNRHSYAIGEPQRAHNHSTFIKQMLIQFVPTEQTKLDTALQYVMYNLIKTDLSFTQTQKILEAVSVMDIANHPEKIQLSMRPFYSVQDISYDPEKVTEYLAQTLDPISHLLSKDDYSDISEETVEAKLLSIIEKNKDNPEFTSWAYENNIWLQIEDNEQSLVIQFDLLTSYLSLLSEKIDHQTVLADYILEMENRGESIWQLKGKDLLTKEIN